MSILDNNAALAEAVAQVAETAGYLWQKGWAERNGGNIVVNVTPHVDADAMRAMPALAPAVEIAPALPALEGCWFYCKGTQRRMRDVARAPMHHGSIIRILPGGGAYEMVADRPVAPTSELPSHLAVHAWLLERGAGCRATLHTHPTALVAMSHRREFLGPDVLTGLLWSMIPETRAFCPRGLGIVPYMLPSSRQLAEATIAEMRRGGYDVVMWEKHGVFVADTDILSAFDQVDVLEKSALIYQTARAMGFEPEGMTGAQMRQLADAFHLPK